MLEVAAALEIVLRLARPSPPRAAAPDATALGQIVAEDLAADLDSPPFTKALMDGYAIRAGDTGPRTVVDELPAGKSPTIAVNPGEAIRIFTGAVMPDGADAVAMQERCERAGDTVQVTDSGLTAGKNVLPRGAEMTAGEIVVQAGSVVTPALLGLLAGIGRTESLLYPRPRVGVLATGNELVGPAQRPVDGQIRNTNGPMLLAQAARLGGIPTDFGIGPDDEEELRSAIQSALDLSDVLLLAGGVSVGDYDLVPKVLASLGVDIHFHKVRMKPGKPLLFGTFGGKLVFGLPGNPGSAFVGFELFVAPALRAILGYADPGPRVRPRILSNDLKANHDRPTYHPAITDDDRVTVSPWIGSSDLRSLARVNAFVVLPAGPVVFAAGTAVNTLILV